MSVTTKSDEERSEGLLFVILHSKSDLSSLLLRNITMEYPWLLYLLNVIGFRFSILKILNWIFIYNCLNLIKKMNSICYETASQFIPSTR